MSPVVNVLVGLMFLLSFAYTVAALTLALGAPVWFAALVGLGVAVAVGVWFGRAGQS